MAQPQVNVGVASENGCILHSGVTTGAVAPGRSSQGGAKYGAQKWVFMQCV